MSKITHIVLEVAPCSEIYEVCREAVNMAIEFDCQVDFTFNGVLVSAHKDSSVRDLAEEQHLKQMRAGGHHA